MAEIPNIRDFKCTYSNSVGISSDVTEGLGLEFPDAYRHSGTMQVLAKAIKDHDGADYCLLPFCRTVEAEAMGADINLGDANAGPRARDPICDTIEDVLALPDINFEKGRVREVLDACGELKKQGETVCLEIVGPFTILTSLMEARHVFKVYRKQRDLMVEVMNKIGGQLLKYIEEGKKRGVDVFIYSDSTGALNILGPVVLAQATNDFLAGFMKKVSDIIDDTCIFLICPKFTYALIDTGNAEYVDHELGGGIGFLDALLKMKGKAKLAGQVCIKNVGVKLANGRFKEVVLK